MGQKDGITYTSKYTTMCNSSTTTSATEVMTEAQFVKRLVSQGTSTNPQPTPPLPLKTPEKERKIPTRRGLDMLLQEIDKNAAKFIPEPEAKKVHYFFLKSLVHSPHFCICHIDFLFSIRCLFTEGFKWALSVNRSLIILFKSISW